MNNIGYEQADIEALWELLKGKKAPYWAQPPGIRAVDFTESFLDEFEERHRDEASRLWEGIETIVTKDLSLAIKLLSNARITHHRLSCVAHQGVGDNTAIFINYVDKTAKRHYSLAIPGINYIYPEINPLSN